MVKEMNNSLDDYLESIENQDDIRRLLRLTLIDNNRFRVLVQALIEGVITLKDLDNIDIVGTRKLDKFINYLNYMKKDISHPDIHATSFAMRKLGLNALIDTLRSTEDMVINFNSNKIHNYIPRVEVGRDRNNVLGYNSMEDFIKDANRVYKKTKEKVNVDMFTYSNSKDISERLNLMELNSVDSIIYDSEFKKNFDDQFIKLFENIPNSKGTYRDTFFNLNNVFHSKLELNSNISNLLINYSLNNKYMVYYTNEIIERVSNKDINSEKIYSELIEFKFSEEINLFKSITKLYIYSYILFHLEPKFGFPMILTNTLINYIKEYGKFITTFYEESYSSMIISE